MAEIDTIIWDVGGVFMRDVPVSERVRKRLDMDTADFDPIWSEQIGLYGTGAITETALWAAFEAAGGEPVDVEEDVLGVALEEELVIYHGVLAHTHHLAGNGYQRQAILSDTIPNHADVLQRRGLYDEFVSPVDTYLSHEIRHRKASGRRAFQYVLDSMGAHPEHTMFIDDKPAYLRTAEEMGITIVQAIGDEEQIIDAVDQALRRPSPR